MLIDWFTVGAQALNFLILLWLMKRFLYKPIFNAIDARAKKIANELASADKKKSDAERKQEEFRKKNETFDKELAALKEKVTAETDKQRNDSIEATKKELENIRKKQQDSQETEQKNLSKEIQKRAQEEIFSVVRKALTELADASLENSIIRVLVKKIHEVSAEDKKAFSTALGQSRNIANVRSTLEISPDQKRSLESVVKETFGSDTSIQYDLNSSEISGIELTANGQRISWGISSYLNSLNQNLEKLTRPAAT